MCEGQTPQREYDVDGDNQPYNVTCSCTQGARKVEWYNAVIPGDDPATHCRPAVLSFSCTMNADGSCKYPGLIPPPEPPTFAATSASVSARTSTSTATVTPVLPSAPTVPSTHWTPPAATPSSTVASPPAPKPAPVATSTSSEVKELNYECTSGSSATRNFTMVTKKNGSTSAVSVQQQCIGSAVSCLAAVADKADTSKPPCACGNGKVPKVLSQDLNTWSCDEEPAAQGKIIGVDS
ncbi:MAG: hypothetical protein PHS79_01055 [Patescibacteria group bacterium]|nr:hypothetical protein [Patescibacteria group bacterium]